MVSARCRTSASPLTVTIQQGFHPIFWRVVLLIRLIFSGQPISHINTPAANSPALPALPTPSPMLSVPDFAFTLPVCEPFCAGNALLDTRCFFLHMVVDGGGTQLQLAFTALAMAEGPMAKVPPLAASAAPVTHAWFEAGSRLALGAECLKRTALCALLWLRTCWGSRRVACIFGAWFAMVAWAFRARNDGRCGGCRYGLGGLLFSFFLLLERFSRLRQCLLHSIIGHGELTEQQMVEPSPPVRVLLDGLTDLRFAPSGLELGLWRQSGGLFGCFADPFAGRDSGVRHRGRWSVSWMLMERRNFACGVIFVCVECVCRPKSVFTLCRSFTVVLV